MEGIGRCGGKIMIMIMMGFKQTYLCVGIFVAHLSMI